MPDLFQVLYLILVFWRKLCLAVKYSELTLAFTSLLFQNDIKLIEKGQIGSSFIIKNKKLWRGDNNFHIRKQMNN